MRGATRGEDLQSRRQAAWKRGECPGFEARATFSCPKRRSQQRIVLLDWLAVIRGISASALEPGGETASVHLLFSPFRRHNYMTTNTPQVAVNDIGSTESVLDRKSVV